MGFELELREDEAVVFEGRHRTSENAKPFAIALTTDALFIPAKKLFAVSDPYVFVRIPHGRVSVVQLRQTLRVGLAATGVLTSATGAAILVAMARGSVEGVAPEHFGIALAVTIAGIVLSIPRTRPSIAVIHDGGTFRWSPPLLVDAASRAEVEELLGGFVDACRRVHIRVVDEREQGWRIRPDEPALARIERAAPALAAGNSVPCASCGEPVPISRWSSWNGFLVPCQACGRYHGKPWSPKVVLLASIVLLELSFFFTMRAWAAAAAAAILTAGSFVGLRMAEILESNTLELLSYALLLLGPLAINAVVLIRHQSRLGQRVTRNG